MQWRPPAHDGCVWTCREVTSTSTSWKSKLSDAVVAVLCHDCTSGFSRCIVGCVVGARIAGAQKNSQSVATSLRILRIATFDIDWIRAECDRLYCTSDVNHHANIGLHPISSENSLVHTLFVEFCLLVVVTAPEAAQEADSAMCLAAGVLPGVRRTR